MSFKPGDRVVSAYHPEYGVVEIVKTYEWRKPAWLLSNGKLIEEDCLVPEEIYNSPLYQALKEEE